MIVKLIVAIGIALTLALTKLFNRSESGFLRALARPRGVTPTGADGAWTTRDHLRAAAAQSITTVLSLVLAFSLFALADHWPGTTRQNILSFVGMATFIYAIYFLGLAGRSLLCASGTRTRSPATRAGS